MKIRSEARENNFDLVTPLTFDPAGGKGPHPWRSGINPGGTIKRRGPGDPLAQNDEMDLFTPLAFDPAVRNLPPPLRRPSRMNWGGKERVAATRERIVRDLDIPSRLS
jgi:hypothetical protein